MPKIGAPPKQKANKEAEMFARAKAKGLALAELGALAARVKQVYLSFRRSLYSVGSPGRAVTPDDENDDITDAWHKTAMLIVESSATVEEWVTAQFSGALDPHSLYPRNLYDENSLKRYRVFTTTERPRVEQMLNAQAAVFLLERGCGKTPREILQDPARFQLTELFVYIAAKAYKLDDIAAPLEPAAKVLLSRTPYKEVYGERFRNIVNDINS